MVMPLAGVLEVPRDLPVAEPEDLVALEDRVHLPVRPEMLVSAPVAPSAVAFAEKETTINERISAMDLSRGGLLVHVGAPLVVDLSRAEPGRAGFGVPGCVFGAICGDCSRVVMPPYTRAYSAARS